MRKTDLQLKQDVERELSFDPLTGNVSSWQTIDDAVAAAWSAPGVTQVIDHLKMTNF